MCDPYFDHGIYLFIVVLMLEYFQGKEVSKLSSATKLEKWVLLTPARSRLSLEHFKFDFDELEGSYDLPGMKVGSCSYSESKCQPWKPFDPSMVLPTSESCWFGAKSRAPMHCSEIKPILLTGDSCKSNLVLFLFPRWETELPSFSIICGVVVSLYRIITITLRFLCFLGIWKHHWESKAAPSIKPSLVLHFAICFSKPCYKELLIVNVQHYSHSSFCIRSSYQREEDLYQQKWCQQCKKWILYALM